MVQVDHKGERQVKIVRASSLDGNCFSITLDSGIPSCWSLEEGLSNRPLPR